MESRPFFGPGPPKKNDRLTIKVGRFFLYQKNSSILLLRDPGLGRKMRDKIKDARNTYSPSTRTVALSMYWMTSTSILTLAWGLTITSMGSWWARLVTSVKKKFFFKYIYLQVYVVLQIIHVVQNRICWKRINFRCLQQLLKKCFNSCGTTFRPMFQVFTT